ncbi:MAG: hypothetical protein AAFN74_19280, partial [Myxococcota bacterium]
PPLPAPPSPPDARPLSAPREAEPPPPAPPVEEKKEKAAPSNPERARRRSSRKPSSKKRPRRQRSSLRRTLKMLKQQPTPEGASVLADAIENAAKSIRDTAMREEITEMARISGAVADLDGLQSALKRLELALRKQPRR